ncbi:Transcription factor protein [Melia azedarach]|uniref:Transcription factor protein n=1 Tax=Melia azedarach TaxID=155640 RepID=A0ACC1YG55_MELAZ|nr:Transcription factor protein [Melia azedarach]
MSSTLLSNPVTNSDRSKRKKKKKSSQSKQDQQNQTRIIKWKSETQQQIYSSKLVQALNQVNIAGAAAAAGASTSAPRRGRAVREAADRVLAVAAKGRTRWSRAILTNRLKLKFRKQKRPQRVPAPPAVSASSRSKKAGFSVLRLKAKSLPTVQRKVRVLGRLVPGCRKQPLPVILEEATDYIAALEMQVRAMSALAELLSGSGGSSSSSSGTGSAPPTS